MGFKLSLPRFNPPRINLPRFNPPKINLPKFNPPKQVFGMFRGTNAGQTPARVSQPKPNLLQRATNFAGSFIRNPGDATQRLGQKINNRATQFGNSLVNNSRNLVNGTVSNTTRLTNFAGTQFTRFENWADRKIKNNYQWAQENRNSGNLVNRAVANLNLGFTQVSKFGNDRINEASSFYRNLRQSDNIFAKGAGYLGGGLTMIGRGLASPITFADPRLSGKQRTGQVVDGVLSYIPIGKIAGVGKKLLGPVGNLITRKAPWLVNTGANLTSRLASTQGGQIFNQFLNRGKQLSNQLGTLFNRNITPKPLQNLEIATRGTLGNINNLPNRIFNRPRINPGVNRVSTQIAQAQNRPFQQLPPQFQGTADDLMRRFNIKRTFTPAQEEAARVANLRMSAAGGKFNPYGEVPGAGIARSDFAKRLNPPNQNVNGPFPYASPELKVTNSTRADLERLFNSGPSTSAPLNPNVNPINQTFELRFPIKGTVNGQEQTLNYVFNANRIEHYLAGNGKIGVRFISPNTYPVNAAGKPFGLGADVKGTVNVGTREALKAQKELMSYLRDQGFSEVWFSNITRVEGGGVQNLLTGGRPDRVYILNP